jgi:hypothetical protein
VQQRVPIVRRHGVEIDLARGEQELDVLHIVITHCHADRRFASSIFVVGRRPLGEERAEHLGILVQARVVNWRVATLVCDIHILPLADVDLHRLQVTSFTQFEEGVIHLLLRRVVHGLRHRRLPLTHRRRHLLGHDRADERDPKAITEEGVRVEPPFHLLSVSLQLV